MSAGSRPPCGQFVAMQHGSRAVENQQDEGISASVAASQYHCDQREPEAGRAV